MISYASERLLVWCHTLDGTYHRPVSRRHLHPLNHRLFKFSPSNPLSRRGVSIYVDHPQRSEKLDHKRNLYETLKYLIVWICPDSSKIYGWIWKKWVPASRGWRLHWRPSYWYRYLPKIARTTVKEESIEIIGSVNLLRDKNSVWIIQKVHLKMQSWSIACWI